VSGEEQQRLETRITSSSEAYNLYLQARFYRNQYSLDSNFQNLRSGEQAIHQAIAADPSFSEAYSMLAYLYIMEGANFTAANSADILTQAEKAARKALELKPSSPEALQSLGGVLTETGRNLEAYSYVRRAASIAPNADIMWDQLGYLCHYMGLLECSESSYRRAIDLNPTTARIYWMHARQLIYQGRSDEAEQELRRVLNNYPNQFKLMSYLGEALYYEGKTDEAQQILDRSLELARDNTDDAPRLLSGFLYASRGQRERIDKAATSVPPEKIVDGDRAYWTGGIHAMLGDRDEAIKWLRRTVELGNHNYPWFQRDKNWDKLRNDPEYRSIMEEVQHRWEEYKKAEANT